MRPSPLLACLALCLGVLQLLLAGLWFIGTGIFGSPFAEMTADGLVIAWAFLIVGPLSAFPAALGMLWNRRIGGGALIVSGVCGCLAAVCFPTGRLWTPIFLVSIFLIMLGAISESPDNSDGAD